ncbi:MAG: hypothetical protein WCP79_07060 [Bacillota bacterium]
MVKRFTALALILTLLFSMTCYASNPSPVGPLGNLPELGADNAILVKDGVADPMYNFDLKWYQFAPNSLLASDANGLTLSLSQDTFARFLHQHNWADVIGLPASTLLGSDAIGATVYVPQSTFAQFAHQHGWTDLNLDVDHQFATTTQLANIDLALQGVKTAEAAALAAAVAAGDAHTDAQTAITSAATANTTANGAVVTANAIDAKATKAQTDSAAAVVTANSAGITAKSALDTAKAAVNPKDGNYIALTTTAYTTAATVAGLGVWQGTIQSAVNGTKGDVSNIQGQLPGINTNITALGAKVDTINASLTATDGVINKRIDSVEKAVNALDDYNITKLGTLSVADIAANKSLPIFEVLDKVTGADMYGAYIVDIITVSNHVEDHATAKFEVNNGYITDILWLPNTRWAGKLWFTQTKMWFGMPLVADLNYSYQYPVDVYASIVSRSSDALVPHIKALGTVSEVHSTTGNTTSVYGSSFGASTNNYTSANVIDKRLKLPKEAYLGALAAGTTLPTTGYKVPNLRYYSKVIVTYKQVDTDGWYSPGNVTETFNIDPTSVDGTANYLVFGYSKTNVANDITSGNFYKGNSKQDDWHSSGNTMPIKEIVPMYGVYIDYKNNTVAAYTSYWTSALGWLNGKDFISIVLEQ